MTNSIDSGQKMSKKKKKKVGERMLTRQAKVNGRCAKFCLEGELVSTSRSSDSLSQNPLVVEMGLSVLVEPNATK